MRHLDIRFDYQALGNGIYNIRDFLMEAYEKIGQQFGRYPTYPITVILYREHEFRMVNNVPEFVAGIYDGKIRIPVNFSRYPLSTLKGILFHEYTHALIHDLAGASCPIWLNEGIAMKMMHSQLPVASAPARQLEDFGVQARLCAGAGIRDSGGQRGAGAQLPAGAGSLTRIRVF